VSEGIWRGHLAAVVIAGAEMNLKGASSGESIVIPITETVLKATKKIKDLLNFPLVYATAGTPNAVFSVAPRDLVRITEAEVVNIKEGLERCKVRIFSRTIHVP
jgi:hypothetical protein